jgi:DNA-binding transcriptional MerR regulator
MSGFSIGQLSAATGVKVPTIRYYEQIGLLESPARTEGNQRRYTHSACDRLQFIAHARAMGFPMDSLKSMLRIARHREAPCADVDELVGERLAEVDERIERLTRLRGELVGMLESCRHGTVADCRALEVLSDHDECHGDH